MDTGLSLKIRNFRLSDNTMRRLRELAAFEHQKEAERYFGISGKMPTATDMIRTLVNRAYDAMKAEPPVKLIDVLSKPERTPKAKGKDTCNQAKPSSTRNAQAAPKSEKKSKRSKKSNVA